MFLAGKTACGFHSAEFRMSSAGDFMVTNRFLWSLDKKHGRPHRLVLRSRFLSRTSA